MPFRPLIMSEKYLGIFVLHRKIRCHSQYFHNASLECEDVNKKRRSNQLNNWLKIGVPILVAVLLVISAVSITFAVTSGNRENRAAASYSPVTVADTGVAKAASCPNCPGYGQAITDDQGTATNPVYVPQGKQASCCTVTAQGTASSQTYRGGCCGSR
jgi:hypothetical protein